MYTAYSADCSCIRKTSSFKAWFMVRTDLTLARYCCPRCSLQHWSVSQSGCPNTLVAKGQFWDPHHYLHAQSLQLQQQVHWAKQIFYWHYSKLTKVPSSVADLGWFISACSPVSAANSPVFNILAKFEKFSKRPFMNSPKIDTLWLGSYIRGEIFFEKNKILGIKD